MGPTGRRCRPAAPAVGHRRGADGTLYVPIHGTPGGCLQCRGELLRAWGHEASRAGSSPDASGGRAISALGPTSTCTCRHRRQARPRLHAGGRLLRDIGAGGAVLASWMSRSGCFQPGVGRFVRGRSVEQAHPGLRPERAAAPRVAGQYVVPEPAVVQPAVYRLQPGRDAALRHRHGRPAPHRRLQPGRDVHALLQPAGRSRAGELGCARPPGWLSRDGPISSWMPSRTGCSCSRRRDQRSILPLAPQEATPCRKPRGGRRAECQRRPRC